MKVEGKNAIQELINSGREITKVLVQDTSVNNDSTKKMISYLKQKGVKVETVSKQQLDRESKTGFNNGIIAYTKDIEFSTLDDIISYAKSRQEDPFIVLVDEVSDPHNLGSIIRICEGAGVHGIVIPQNRSCPINETVVKVSTGAIFNMRIARVTNLNDAIRYIKKQNIFVYSMEANGESIYKTNLTGALAMVVGSEGFGVSKLTKDLSDGIVSLPMNGKINSLNASVACGICVYEAVRQRLK